MSLYSNHLAKALFVLCLTGCVSASGASDPVTITQQTAGQLERFTQPELDIAFRKQARDDANAFSRDQNLNVCCVLFYDDVKMLSKVFAHFEKNVSTNVNDYGVVVQEDEKHYIVSFTERYRESMQYQAGGFWNPGTSDPGLKLYSYLVDRKTLEILEFIEVPS